MFIVYANCLQVTSDCSKHRCIGNRVSRTFLRHTFLDSHLTYWASLSILAQLLGFIVIFYS